MCVCVLFTIVIHVYISLEGLHGASQVALVVKNSPVKCRRQKRQGVVQSLGHEDLEEGMATHSSILAWRIPGTEEPGGLQSMGSQSQTRLKRLSTAQRDCI